MNPAGAVRTDDIIALQYYLLMSTRDDWLPKFIEFLFLSPVTEQNY